MRLAACALCASIVLVGSCGERALQPRLMGEQEVTGAVRCAGLPSTQGAVADLVTVSDSTIAALFDEDRTLTIYGPSLTPLTSLRFDADGPRGVQHPASAAFGDSLIYVADDARSQIRTFDWLGTDRGSLQLKFIPRRVRAAGGELVVTPLVAGGSPGQLLYVIRDREVRPLGGSLARYEDLVLNTIANMVAISAFPARFSIMHEMVVPFGYIIRTSSEVASVRRVALPVPASEAGRLRDLPRERISEKNVNALPVVAFAATENRATGGSFYVTRSGDGERRPYRKIVVELDSLMQLQRAFHIDAHPHHLAYLHARRALIAVDAEDRWFECHLP